MFKIEPGKLNLNFIAKQNLFITISTFVVCVSLVVLAIKNLKLGTDFRGGTELHIKVDQKVSIQDLRDALAKDKDHGLGSAEVQTYGSPEKGKHEFLVKVEQTSLLTVQDSQIIKTALEERYDSKLKFDFNSDADKIEVVMTPEENPDEVATFISEKNKKLVGAKVSRQRHGKKYEYLIVPKGVSSILSSVLTKNISSGVEVLRVDFVGAKVGRELRDDGIISVILCLCLILFYIAMRFDFYFAPGAIIALVHDVLITLGIFSLLEKDFNLPTIAAILTIVGYSLNDTVVVFDRIRDNLVRYKGKKFREMINLSLNQTLSRTVLTSVTTLMVVTVLFVYGGGVIHDFSFALMIGVVVGTYSSIFIATPVYIILKEKFENAT